MKMKTLTNWAGAAIMAVAAICVTTSCSDTEVLADTNPTAENSNDNAVTFGTYLGRSTQTRAGETGALTTEKLKNSANGFGVFAYYTGKDTYGQYQCTTYSGETAGTSTADQVANFMFNQQVKWDESATTDYITHWYYTPIKYWPNEVQSGAVDDQDNDESDNQATGSGTYGGNLSFFAYAPYVSMDITSTTDGITAINGKTELSSANAVTGDPTITYVVPSTGADVVDLLWGTYGTTSTNVLGGSTNAGVSYSSSAAANTYQAAILDNGISGTDGYTLNADLTKQNTKGTVNFAFKHALSKVGGSTTTLSGSTTTNGLMVVLDLDDQKGNESEGTKDATTLVTIKSVKIDAVSMIDDDNDGTPDTYLKSAQGVLDLATGQWDITKTITTADDNISTDKTDATVTKHYLYESNSTESDKTADLATSIAEPSSTPTYSSGWSLTGVTTTAQNVYKSTDVVPLVFIPGTYPELTVTVDYFVRTYDANLSTTYSEVEQVITKKVTFANAVELNKQYNLLMLLGLTSVKFTATVSDWVVDGDTDGDGTISGTESVDIEDIYVPRNVSYKIQEPTIALGATDVTFSVEPKTLDLSSETISVTATKDGSDLSITLCTPTYAATNGTQIPVTIPAASAGIYVFSITIGSTTSTVTVTVS